MLIFIPRTDCIHTHDLISRAADVNASPPLSNELLDCGKCRRTKIESRLNRTDLPARKQINVQIRIRLGPVTSSRSPLSPSSPTLLTLTPNR